MAAKKWTKRSKKRRVTKAATGVAEPGQMVRRAGKSPPRSKLKKKKKFIKRWAGSENR